MSSNPLAGLVVTLYGGPFDGQQCSTPGDHYVAATADGLGIEHHYHRTAPDRFDYVGQWGCGELDVQTERKTQP